GGNEVRGLRRGKSGTRGVADRATAVIQSRREAQTHATRKGTSDEAHPGVSASVGGGSEGGEWSRRLVVGDGPLRGGRRGGAGSDAVGAPAGGGTGRVPRI